MGAGWNPIRQSVFQGNRGGVDSRSLASIRNFTVFQISNGDQNPSDQSEHHLEEGC